MFQQCDVICQTKSGLRQLLLASSDFGVCVCHFYSPRGSKEYVSEPDAGPHQSFLISLVVIGS